ncbi:MAG: GNAT family N-acetyltransferase [Anaerolineales bacterium]|nr:GNAT family N-acetyltransferase [Chloroflexota bacterium]MBL7161859.1 GNAT family N-acetyltransferase [Anaerolineales bacterium]
MSLEIIPAVFEDKLILRNLLELYQYDFSEFDASDVDEHGLFGYKYLDNYWAEPGRHAFLIRFAGRLAGFALVREVADEVGVHHSMAEFFIMRKYRRRGIGRKVAAELFDHFPGTWRVHQEAANLPAQTFWRNTIAAYTNDQFAYVEEDGWEGPIIEFEITSNSSAMERIIPIKKSEH